MTHSQPGSGNQGNSRRQYKLYQEDKSMEIPRTTYYRMRKRAGLVASRCKPSNATEHDPEEQSQSSSNHGGTCIWSNPDTERAIMELKESTRQLISLVSTLRTEFRTQPPAHAITAPTSLNRVPQPITTGITSPPPTAINTVVKTSPVNLQSIYPITGIIPQWKINKAVIRGRVRLSIRALASEVFSDNDLVECTVNGKTTKGSLKDGHVRKLDEKLVTEIESIIFHHYSNCPEFGTNPGRFIRSIIGELCRDRAKRQWKATKRLRATTEETTEEPTYISL
ncbi:uncharacterized protein [Amphiura filiformis]|uniref:uncharacterized protein n=1 Tax=Amphiura filiformis TaxID=82378 RepID=UPI003B227D78